MNIRMIAFDIDGTLKGKENHFPEINCRALQECQRRGIRLVFCSGRAFEVLRDFAKQVGVDPLMASCNGARIDASIFGPTLVEHTYDDAHSRRVYELLLASGMYFLSYTHGMAYMGNAQERYSLGRYQHHTPYTKHTDGYTYEMVEDARRLEREGTKSPYKYVALGHAYDPRFEEIRTQIAGMNMSVSSSSKYNFEIMMPGVDKGAAIRFLAEREGISMENVMAFGDNTNDLPMLNAAGWPVAMQNGEDCVKAVAKLIAPENTAGGVGQVIEKYILN